MNEQMRHLVAALYAESVRVPAVQVPSALFRRMAEIVMRQSETIEDAKIIEKESA